MPCDCQLAPMKNSSGSINSEGADIRPRNVLTLSDFHGISIYEILAMRHCRKRGGAALAGVASSKRPLFWMIVAIAAARSVSHERAAFVTSWGSCERTLFFQL